MKSRPESNITVRLVQSTWATAEETLKGVVKRLMERQALNLNTTEKIFTVCPLISGILTLKD